MCVKKGYFLFFIIMSCNINFIVCEGKLLMKILGFIFSGDQEIKYFRILTLEF